MEFSFGSVGFAGFNGFIGSDGSSLAHFFLAFRKNSMLEKGKCMEITAKLDKWLTTTTTTVVDIWYFFFFKNWSSNLVK